MKTKMSLEGTTSAALNSVRRRISNLFLARSRHGAWLALLTLAALMVAVAPTEAFAPKKKKPVPKDVQGLVLDSANNPISGAAVELKDVQTGKTIAIYSDNDGNYQFTDLDRDHDYEIRASYKNMASGVRKVSSFDNRNTIPMNLTLEPVPSK
jgi:carboxypeptidase family protein